MCVVRRAGANLIGLSRNKSLDTQHLCDLHFVDATLVPKDLSGGLSLKAVLKGQHIVRVGLPYLLAFADGSFPQASASPVYLPGYLCSGRNSRCSRSTSIELGSKDNWGTDL
jgi:hypothetical protein